MIQYFDDSLIAGKPTAIQHLKQEMMQKYFKCKFVSPKDFLGLDLTLPEPGEITVSLLYFTKKMILVPVLKVNDIYPGDIITPGRTDKKAIRGE